MAIQSVTAPGSSQLARFLSIPEACAYTRVTRRTIYNWMAQGKLTVYRSAGGAVRLDPAELVRREDAKS